MAEILKISTMEVKRTMITILRGLMEKRRHHTRGDWRYNQMNGNSNKKSKEMLEQKRCGGNEVFL